MIAHSRNDVYKRPDLHYLTTIDIGIRLVASQQGDPMKGTESMRYVTITIEVDDDDDSTPEDIIESIPWAVSYYRNQTQYDGTAIR